MIHANAPRFAAIRTLGLVGMLTAGLVASAVVPALARSTGTWTIKGSLNIARSSHTATLLPNGQVLVAGGQSTLGTALASAELYTP